MPKRPTQADVAELAGVSRATVSYVLNQRVERDIPISDETRQRVWDAAQRLGYEPSALAQNLKAGHSYTIGVLTPNLHNLHYLEILDSVEAEAASNGYHLSVVSSNFDLERERSCLSSLLQQRLDGVVLMPTFLDMLTEELATLRQRMRPAVSLIKVEGFDCVVSDIYQGAEALMDHLLGLGHRRIALVNGVVRRTLTAERQRAYHSKLTAAGVPEAQHLVVDCGPTMDDAYEATLQLLDMDPCPTAIWTINDLLAVGALRAIHERGLRVPADVAVAGYDDSALAAQLYPPLTSVRSRAHDLGRRAVQILLRRIEEPAGALSQEVIPVDLVVRQSTIGNGVIPTVAVAQAIEV